MTPPRYFQEWVDLKKYGQTTTIVSPQWKEGDWHAREEATRALDHLIHLKTLCGWVKTRRGISKIPVPDFTLTASS